MDGSKISLGKLIMGILIFPCFIGWAYYSNKQHYLDQRFEGFITGKRYDSSHGEHQWIYVSDHHYPLGIDGYNCFDNLDTGYYVVKKEGKMKLRVSKTPGDTTDYYPGYFMGIRERD